MPYNPMSDYFWSNVFFDLFLLIGGSFLLLWLFNVVMRRWLGVRKTRFFRMHYVTDAHRKWDFKLRMGYLAILLLVLLFLMSQGLYLTWFVLLLIPLYVIQVSLQAYMEWKHGDGRTQAVYDVVEFGFLLIVLLMLTSLLFPKFFF